MPETFFAMELYTRGGGGAPFARWQATVQAQLAQPSSRRGLAQVVRSVRLSPQAFATDADCRTVESPGQRRQDDIVAALARFHAVGLAPFWSRMQALLIADRESRGRIALSGGLGRLLSTLHPQIRWDPPVLHVGTVEHRSADVSLHGRGLAIVPSLFRSEPVVYDAFDGEDVAPVLVYPVALDTADAQNLWRVTSSSDQVLADLLGRTRAGILRTLTDTCNTTEVGRRLGISTAAASQHTSVLRRAGLITTRRNLNTVLHTLTPLGVALIQGVTSGGRRPR
jgi:DNA-binding transcriptional ArsR family regulator